MRKSLAISATLIVALAAPSAAAAEARETAHQFAVGSAKTEFELEIPTTVGLEHAAFSAQNLSRYPSCKAKGQIVYRNPMTAFTAKIDELVLVGKAAYFRGVTTKASGFVMVGVPVHFSVLDSGLGGGTGDEFLFEGTTPPQPPCVPPVPPKPITKGNIVVKSFM